MEHALVGYGLPVHCADCGATGLVQPNDYGGWGRWKRTGGRSKWYCPKDIDSADTYEFLRQRHISPPFESAVAVAEEDAEAELYKLLEE